MADATEITLPLTGRCMCGAVRFAVAEPLLGAVYCHCRRCQRRSGTMRSMTALAAPGTFAVTAGADVLKVYDPGDGYLKSFCTTCGSHTHTTNRDDPTLVAVRMGCLDGDPGVRPTAHQYVSYAMSYEALPDDGLPRFPERVGVGDPLP